MTHQTTFAHAEFANKKKTTRREKFLARMEEVIPWAKLLAVIEPHYPQGKRGRPPIGLERMLRVYFLQQWYGLADEALEIDLGDLVLADLSGVATEELVDDHGRFDPLIAGDERWREPLVERGRVVGFTFARPEFGCGRCQPAPCHRP